MSLNSLSSSCRLVSGSGVISESCAENHFGRRQIRAESREQHWEISLISYTLAKFDFKMQSPH